MSVATYQVTNIKLNKKEFYNEFRISGKVF